MQIRPCANLTDVDTMEQKPTLATFPAPQLLRNFAKPTSADVRDRKDHGEERWFPPSVAPVGPTYARLQPPKYRSRKTGKRSVSPPVRDAQTSQRPSPPFRPWPTDRRGEAGTQRQVPAADSSHRTPEAQQ